MQTGKVRIFDEIKGFGIIMDDDTHQDIFFHIADTNGVVIGEDERVAFDKRGLNAANVKKI
jgi:cold shock CspA family protein